jgi:hypothetical protein
MNRQFILLLTVLCVSVILGACGDKAASDRASAPPSEALEAPPSDDEQINLIVAGADERAYQLRNTPRLVIKNGDMSLLVEDIDSTRVALTGIAAQYGGYVLQTSANRTGVDSATITIAVESANFEHAIQSIRETGLEVLNESTSGEDVTAEYVDLESRLRNLEATRDRLRGFLDDAQNVEEALSVNAELSRIEGEIEQAKGRMSYLSGRAAFSTITITLREPSPKPKSDKGWSPRQALDDAFDAQKELVRWLIDFAIWLVVFAGPYLLIAGLGFWGWWRWVRHDNQT